MHTVELLEEALRLADRLGYGVRQEWLGTGCGACEFRGRRWLFVDLSQTAFEQLQQVRDVLLQDPGIHQVALSQPVARWLRVRQAA